MSKPIKPSKNLVYCYACKRRKMLFEEKSEADNPWSFSGLATIVRIMLMYYIDVMGFLEHLEKDWEVAVEEAISSPPVTE